MADDVLTELSPTEPGLSEPGLSEPGLSEPSVPRPVRAPAQNIWIAALGAFVLGLGVSGWLGWLSGADFGRFFGLPRVAGNAGMAGSGPAQEPGQTQSSAAVENAVRDEMALAGRVAAMEQRLDRVDLRMAAASGNAARAEALLVAFAVRRVVERGAPLGYLADQLKLRFGEAQPNAVATIIAGNRDPVSPAQLAARLEALAPQLTEAGQQPLWRRITHELTEMFVVRRDSPARLEADARFDDARKALSEGRIDDAMADVQHLSNGPDAAGWTAAAQRTREVERALDLIDTTALLDPRQLHDANGNPLNPVMR